MKELIGVAASFIGRPIIVAIFSAPKFLLNRFGPLQKWYRSYYRRVAQHYEYSIARQFTSNIPSGPIKAIRHMWQSLYVLQASVYNRGDSRPSNIQDCYTQLMISYRVICLRSRNEAIKGCAQTLVNIAQYTMEGFERKGFLGEHENATIKEICDEIDASFMYHKKWYRRCVPAWCYGARIDFNAGLGFENPFRHIPRPPVSTKKLLFSVARDTLIGSARSFLPIPLET